MPPKILVVCGPTASGKTRLAVELALRTGGEVVSADSMQVYRGMDIGTAKPTAEEMRGVPHHMLDVADPSEAYSVSRYVQQAGACVDGILARGKLPILAGGTGLYIDHLVAGRRFAAFSGARRAALMQALAQRGVEALYAELQAADPLRAAVLHPNDEKRIVRALEVYYETGKPMSAHDAESGAAPPRYEAITLALAFGERAHMRARIDRRVDEMMAQGLADEVRSLLRAGLSDACTAMQAIGYKELAAGLRAGASLSACAEEIKLRTRQYAKRQLTWFRRTSGARWIFWDERPDFSKAVHDSTRYMQEVNLL